MVEIQGNMPKNPQQMQADQDVAVNKSLGKIKNKILVMSGKGGVGKTSTSVNLSVALAHKGYNVGLMDVDLHGPDVPRMLGLEGTPQVNESGQGVESRYPFECRLRNLTYSAPIILEFIENGVIVVRAFFRLKSAGISFCNEIF